MGVGIGRDVKKLRRDGFITEGEEATILGGCQELTSIVRQVFPTHGRHWSLSKMVFFVLQQQLDKQGSSRISAWERHPLTADQVQYAALDAVAHLRVFVRLQQQPPPEPPPSAGRPATQEERDDNTQRRLTSFFPPLHQDTPAAGSAAAAAHATQQRAPQVNPPAGRAAAADLAAAAHPQSLAQSSPALAQAGSGPADTPQVTQGQQDGGTDPEVQASPQPPRPTPQQTMQHQQPMQASSGPPRPLPQQAVQRQLTLKLRPICSPSPSPLQPSPKLAVALQATRRSAKASRTGDQTPVMRASPQPPWPTPQQTVQQQRLTCTTTLPCGCLAKRSMLKRSKPRSTT